LPQAGISCLGRPLVDRSPRHVQGDEVVAQYSARRHRHEWPKTVAQTEGPPQASDALFTGYFAVRGEDFGDRLAVPELLVDPETEEGCDLGIRMRRAQEQVPEVTHRVKLDIVHVAQAAQCGGVERLTVKRIGKVEVCPFQAAGAALVGLEVEVHVLTFGM
jgi:hypothetical protein